MQFKILFAVVTIYLVDSVFLRHDKKSCSDGSAPPCNEVVTVARSRHSTAQELGPMRAHVKMAKQKIEKAAREANDVLHELEHIIESAHGDTKQKAEDAIADGEKIIETAKAQLESIKTAQDDMSKLAVDDEISDELKLAVNGEIAAADQLEKDVHDVQNQLVEVEIAAHSEPHHEEPEEPLEDAPPLKLVVHPEPAWDDANSLHVESSCLGHEHWEWRIKGWINFASAIGYEWPGNDPIYKFQVNQYREHKLWWNGTILMISNKDWPWLDEYCMNTTEAQLWKTRVDVWRGNGQPEDITGWECGGCNSLNVAGFRDGCMDWSDEARGKDFMPGDTIEVIQKLDWGTPSYC